MTYALEVASHGKVGVLFKRGLEESSTSWAQGGIAAVSTADDDYNLHIQDTIISGAGLCKPEIVEMVVREAPQRIEKLVSLGVSFDKDKKGGKFHLNQEGGHSKRRIYHAADHTGYVILQSLLAAV